MNVATQALATADPAGAARRSGTMRAIIASGPVSGLVAGAIVAHVAGPRAAFLLLAVAALLAFPFAFRLPKGGEGRPERLPRPRFGVPSRLDTWSFVQGMTLDGLFVLGLSVLAAVALPGYAVLAAGAALALRYVAEILLAPLGGKLAERYGPRLVLTVLSVATALGLGVIGAESLWAGALWIGAVVVVLLRGLIQPIAAPVVALENPGRDRVPALARLATWRDLGAGAGPLLAGALLPLVAHEVLYGAAAALLAVSAVAVSAARTKQLASTTAEDGGRADVTKGRRA
jgi:MFS family permease